MSLMRQGKAMMFSDCHLFCFIFPLLIFVLSCGHCKSDRKKTVQFRKDAVIVFYWSTSGPQQTPEQRTGAQAGDKHLTLTDSQQKSSVSVLSDHIKFLNV